MTVHIWNKALRRTIIVLVCPVLFLVSAVIAVCEDWQALGRDIRESWRGKRPAG